MAKNIPQPYWVRDPELLRLIREFIAPIKDDSFYRKIDRFFGTGKRLDFELNNDELSILESGVLTVLGCDKLFKKLIASLAPISCLWIFRRILKDPAASFESTNSGSRGRINLG